MKRSAELVGLAVDRDRALLHRLEQGRLGLGRRAVDLVGQQQLAEDRPAGQREAAMVWKLNRLAPMMSPGIRSGVNWMRPKSSPSARAKHVREQGLGRARRPFEQDVPAGEQGDQHQVDRLLLADDRLADLCRGSPGRAFEPLRPSRRILLQPEIERCAPRAAGRPGLRADSQPMRRVRKTACPRTRRRAARRASARLSDAGRWNKAAARSRMIST